MFAIPMGRNRSVILSALVAVVLASNASAQAPFGQGDAYVLTNGVSKLQSPGHDLTWADQDAIDHNAFWALQEGGLFRKVYRWHRVNRQATKANILKDMEEVEKLVKAYDTVIFTAQGHGGAAGGEWKFCPYDYQATGGLSASELRAWASRLAQKNVRVILIIDTCEAGALDIEVEGVVVLMASRANESSSDGNPYLLKDNGLFDKVMFEAFSGKADKNGDGIITIGEAIDYINERMAQLTSKQHPTFNGFALKAKDMPFAMVSVSGPKKDVIVPPMQGHPGSTGPIMVPGPTGPSVH